MPRIADGERSFAKATDVRSQDAALLDDRAFPAKSPANPANMTTPLSHLSEDKIEERLTDVARSAVNDILQQDDDMDLPPPKLDASEIISAFPQGPPVVNEQKSARIF